MIERLERLIPLGAVLSFGVYLFKRYYLQHFGVTSDLVVITPSDLFNVALVFGLVIALLAIGYGPLTLFLSRESLYQNPVSLVSIAACLNAGSFFLIYQMGATSTWFFIALCDLTLLMALYSNELNRWLRKRAKRKSDVTSAYLDSSALPSKSTVLNIAVAIAIATSCLSAAIYFGKITAASETRFIISDSCGMAVLEEQADWFVGVPVAAALARPGNAKSFVGTLGSPKVCKMDNGEQTLYWATVTFATKT